MQNPIYVDDNTTTDNNELYFSINDLTVTEGNEGTTNATFTVVLQNDLGRATTEEVTVDFATLDNTAESNIDFINTSGTLIFAPETTTRSITIPVIADETAEGDENFYVDLSNPTGTAEIKDSRGIATIEDDDIPTRITIGDRAFLEGDGNKTANFVVSLDAARDEEITVDYSTSDGTATIADNDYKAAEGTVTFAPGETEATIPVEITGDLKVESDEDFVINLGNPSDNAQLESDRAIATIKNDDEGESSTVYRFFNDEVGVHFYTASTTERDYLLDNLPQYSYEGASFTAAPEEDSLTGIEPVYRFFNQDTGVHLYTMEETERDYVRDNLDNYDYEGIAYYGYETQQQGTIPLYRFYNPVIDAHFYTPSVAEKESVSENLPDYQLEGDDGIAFYVRSVEM